MPNIQYDEMREKMVNSKMKNDGGLEQLKKGNLSRASSPFNIGDSKITLINSSHQGAQNPPPNLTSSHLTSNQ